jgi:hypothetical protein
VSTDGRSAILANEFASVLVELDSTANGPRLRVCDPSSGRAICLDPLELQAIAWARHETFAEILRPSFTENQVSADDLA